MKLAKLYLSILLLVIAQNATAYGDLFIGYEGDRQSDYQNNATYFNYNNTATASADPVSAAATLGIFDLAFDFTRDTNGFFSDPTLGAVRTGLLESAATYFESIIIDELTAITSISTNQFNAVFTNPGSGNSETINGFSVVANTLTIFVGGRSFGGNTLGQGGPGGFGVSGTQAFVNNAVSRGEVGVGTTDFAPWGGSLAFNNESNWYYDPDVSDNSIFGISAGESDFYSVALHEIGHVLGLGTSGAWNSNISGGNFTGTNVTAANGGVSPSASGGHFAEGTTGTVNGVSQEVAMDPSILTGTQKKFTNIDIAALQDIGWDLVASPN